MKQLFEAAIGKGGELTPEQASALCASNPWLWRLLLSWDRVSVRNRATIAEGLYAYPLASVGDVGPLEFILRVDIDPLCEPAAGILLDRPEIAESLLSLIGQRLERLDPETRATFARVVLALGVPRRDLDEYVLKGIVESRERADLALSFMDSGGSPNAMVGFLWDDLTEWSGDTEHLSKVADTILQLGESGIAHAPTWLTMACTDAQAIFIRCLLRCSEVPEHRARGLLEEAMGAESTTLATLAYLGLVHLAESLPPRREPLGEDQADRIRAWQDSLVCVVTSRPPKDIDTFERLIEHAPHSSLFMGESELRAFARWMLGAACTDARTARAILLWMEQCPCATDGDDERVSHEQLSLRPIGERILDRLGMKVSNELLLLARILDTETFSEFRCSGAASLPSSAIDQVIVQLFSDVRWVRSACISILNGAGPAAAAVVDEEIAHGHLPKRSDPWWQEPYLPLRQAGKQASDRES